MNAYQWILDELAPAFCKTLLHSLWLGLLAAVLTGIVLIITKKQAASLRYQLLMLVFSLLFLSTIIAFFVEVRLPAASSITSAETHQIKAASLTTDIETAGPAAEEYQVFSSLMAFLDKHAIMIFSSWFLLFAFHLVRMGIGLHHIHRIRHTKNHPVESFWNEWLQERSCQLGIRQKVQFLQSELVNIPVAIGFLKPMILVPVGLLTQLNASQVETVLLHELAHIRRKDYVINLFQNFVEAIFFFNPAFTWISALIRQERENSCDDMVIHQSGDQAAYFEALLSFQSLHHSKTYAMALGNRKHSLLNRVSRMLTRQNSTLTLKEIFSLGSGLVIAGFCLMAFHPAEPLASQAGIKLSPVSRMEFAPTSYMTKFIKPANNVNNRQLANRRSQLKCDTIPKKNSEVKAVTDVKPGSQPRFKEIISNISDDGTNSVHQVQATAIDGTVYKIRKVQNEIISFTINGKEIAKEEYSTRYNEVIQAIDQDRKRKTVEKNKIMEQKHLALKNRQAVLANKQAILNHEKNIKRDSLKKLHSLKQIERSKLKLNQLNKPARLSKNPQLESIIRDIINAGLAKDETKISFSLNDTQFIINGVVQPESVFQNYRSRYLRSPGDRFSYSRDGNTTKTEIHIN